MQSIDNQIGNEICNTQIFPLEGLTPTFSLRSPKSNKPTMVYLNVRINNKTLTLSTTVKVYPKHWDKEQKKAITSNRLTVVDNNNNNITNNRLEECCNIISEVKYYLCNCPTEMGNVFQLIKEKVYKDKVMNRQKKKGGYEGGTLATIELMRLVEKDTTISKSTKTNKLREIKLFGNWLVENNIPNTWEGLSKVTLRKYENYLIEEKKNETKHSNN